MGDCWIDFGVQNFRTNQQVQKYRAKGHTDKFVKSKTSGDFPCLPARFPFSSLT
jgi:hypothetical protein